jgi:hypothetical protein
VIAESEGRPIAASLDLITDGASMAVLGFPRTCAGLHFEACYYQAWKFCIERGIQRLKAERKASTNTPAASCRGHPSLHWLAHPAFYRAIDDYLERRARRHPECTWTSLPMRTPFRRQNGAPHEPQPGREGRNDIGAPKRVSGQRLSIRQAIEKYMFGTHVTSTWPEGKPITWKGEMKGKAYEDKGEILDIEPDGALATAISARSRKTGHARELPHVHHRATG